MQLSQNCTIKQIVGCDNSDSAFLLQFGTRRIVSNLLCFQKLESVTIAGVVSGNYCNIDKFVDGSVACCGTNQITHNGFTTIS